MKDFNLDNCKKIHFIGIGGIGISAIARMMSLKAKKISGSDAFDSENIKELEKIGCKISIGHKESNINSNLDLVIYTIAVPNNNPELKRARDLNIPTLSYPEALGLISKDHYTIAISGTHGKTTTTALTSKIFIDAGLKPTAIVGSLLKDSKSNFIAGKSKFFIVEACEYKRSFLNLNPSVLAIINIDNDHLDYYKNLKDIQTAFSELAVKVPADGYLVCDPSDSRIKPILKTAKCRIFDYTKIKPNFKLKFPGKHNIGNAKIAYALAKLADVEDKKIIRAIRNFNGTLRRFDYKGKTERGALIYDDYAHHPTEIKVTIKAFKEKYPNKCLIVVFQPHLFSRTKLLLNEFAKSFKGADKIIVAPIYAAREKYDQSINSSILAEKIKGSGNDCLALENFDKISDYLLANESNNDLIVTMGAGDIYKVGEKLIGPMV